MSEMRELMLRSLDRLVSDAFDANARAAADGGGTFPQALWQALEAQGMTAIGEIAEGDLGYGDAMALVRRAAYHTLPVPLGETVLARRLLARAEIDLPEGPLTVAPPRAAVGAALSSGSLTGLAAAVPWARFTQHAVLAVQGHLVLADVSDAVARQGVNTAGEPRDTVDLSRAAVARSASLPDAEGVLEAEGALLRAAQMAGALSRVLDLSLVWVNERVQFGKPIARFQAVQHMMAQLAAEVAAASAAADLALEASVSAPDRFAIGVAKARIGEAAGKAAAIAHQVFGAMGFTREHPLHYATRRLWAWRDEFGGEAYWQAEIGRAAAERGADGLWAMLTARA